MMIDDIHATFAPDGLLSQKIAHFTPRASQTEMAMAIGQAIKNKANLVAEAGTGTGKTYAYLVPALFSGGRVLISTATKTLQDQLFTRDLPTIVAALSLPIVTALLKGRENYLCYDRLDKAQQRTYLFSESQHIAHIARWAETTQTGDKAELSSVSDQSSVWPLVTSTKDNCLGSDCPRFSDCLVMKARREALSADVVVVNHHLFLADLTLKEQEVGELLPTVSLFIFDEAHQLPDIATLFFGQSLSTAQLTTLAQDINAIMADLPVDSQRQSTCLRAWDSAIIQLKSAFPSGSVKLSKQQLPPKHSLFEALENMLTAQKALSELLADSSDDRPEIELLLNRLEDVRQITHDWQHSQDDEMINWLETSPRFVRLYRSPLSAANFLKKHWEENPVARIFLSATLAVERNFSHFIGEIGLTNPVTHYWQSPFDYTQQTLLYIPKISYQPNEPGFTEAVVTEALSFIPHGLGGAFFLFTSLAAVTAAKRLVEAWLEKTGEQRLLLVQGDASRTELLNRFRESGHAILLGSYSFWEGVDVSGPSLSFVLIDKIPFQPPDDPVLMAKSDHVKRQGKNPFMSLQLPKAVISLKQGTGRLIRSETDTGLLMIGDTRLFSKGYGRQILQSLPFPVRAREKNQVIDFLDQKKQDTALLTKDDAKLC